MAVVRPSDSRQSLVELIPEGIAPEDHDGYIGDEYPPRAELVFQLTRFTQRPNISVQPLSDVPGTKASADL